MAQQDSFEDVINKMNQIKTIVKEMKEPLKEIDNLFSRLLGDDKVSTKSAD
jgi:hypothetical protein